MAIDVTCVELCAPTCVFVYEGRQTIPGAKWSGCHQAHTHTQASADLLTDGDTQWPDPLPDQKCSPGALPESHSPTRVQLPHVWPTIPVPPLCSYFLSSLSPPPPSLINVKPSNNKDAILSPPPASSAPRICHYALTLPHRQPCSHRHPFHMVPELEPKAHAANMKGCSEGARGREKSEEEAFLSL